MKACFFGSFHKEYSRNKILVHGLEKNNIQVNYCHSNSKFFFRFFELINKGLKQDFDFMWVAYPGHLDVIPAKIVCWLKNKPLFFDVFISKMDSEIEYKLIKKESLRAKFLGFIDWLSCKLPDKVFLDTEEHINFFTTEFKLPKKKFSQLFVGSNQEIFYPRKQIKKNNKFTILYYGKTTPLHGLKFILKAAEIIEKKEPEINFRLFGENRFYRDLKKKYSKLTNCEFNNTIPIEQIAEEIANADICLGIFGTSPKAERVIPNKVFDPLAMKKPVITMYSEATNGILIHKQNAFLVKKGNAEEIAEGIIKLYNNKELKKSIAQKGYELFMEKFSEEKIGKKLINEIKKVIK